MTSFRYSYVLTRAKKRRKDWLQSAWMYKSSRQEFNVIALVTLIIILKHIQPHSQARNYGRSGGYLTCPFLKIGKSALKKDPDYFHLWVKFFIQNVDLIASRRKNSKMFSCGAFFCVFLKKILSKSPSSMKPSLS